MTKLTAAKILVIVLAIHIVNGRQIQVPAIKDQTVKDIKIGRLEQIKQPDFDFKSVYSRKVYQADNTSMQSFGPCSQNRPQVQFQITDEILFDGRPPRPLVTYKFNDIKYSQFLLDAYYENNTVYMIFQDAIGAVVYLDKKKEIKDYKVINIDGLEPKTSLQLGYFAKINNKIIFVNNAYAIEMNQTHAYRLQGYESKKLFTTAIAIQQTFLAVGYEQDGVVFYKISNDRLQKVYELKPAQILTDGTTLQLTDLAYYKAQKSLLVLENDQGVLSFDIQKTSEGIKVSKGPVFIRKKSCNLMELSQYTLHVVCKDIYRISLSDWPRVEEKTLPHPSVKIRAIYSEGPLVAFIGRNIFRLLYLDRLVNYFEDQSMDKLIFSKDLFISANEGGLMIGSYTIRPPYITCQTMDQKMAGSHSLMFKTVAECNQKFFRQFNINIESMGKLEEDDTCVYTVYHDVYFWKTGKIMVLPIIITLIVFLIIALGVIIIWAVKKLSLRRVQQQLMQYTALAGTGINHSEKHQELVEEAAETGNNRSGANNKQDEEEEQAQKKPSELELHNQNYDIQ